MPYDGIQDTGRGPNWMIELAEGRSLQDADNAAGSGQLPLEPELFEWLPWEHHLAPLPQALWECAATSGPCSIWGARPLKTDPPGGPFSVLPPRKK